jgi:hypothetical protein
VLRVDNANEIKSETDAMTDRPKKTELAIFPIKECAALKPKAREDFQSSSGADSIHLYGPRREWSRHIPPNHSTALLEIT